MSALYDHAKQYDDEWTSHVKWRWNLHGNISRNGYGNAMIGRYGGCFEEDIMRLMCNRAYHVTGFGCTGESCTDPQGENGLCTVPKRLANMRRWRCVCPWCHISHKELTYLLQSFISFITNQSTPRMPRGRRLVGVNHRAPPTQNNTRISTRNINAHTSSPCLFNF